MTDYAGPLLIGTVTFLIAGLVKGVTGIGLPAVAMGLLSLAMTPAEAAALLVVPALATNLWQLAVGSNLPSLFRRLWSMMLAICFGTWAGAGLLIGDTAGHATTALGVALMLYAIVGLARRPFHVPTGAEHWLSPIVGAATGLVTAATGVFTMPAVPYLQALGLEKEDLVQALGLSFTISTLALAVDLAHDGALHAPLVGASVLALAPAVSGMLLGQWLRIRLRPDVFQFYFFLALLMLGGDLALRALS